MMGMEAMRATPLGTSRLGVHDVMGFVKGKGQGLPVFFFFEKGGCGIWIQDR